jgi:hypothetical protein
MSNKINEQLPQEENFNFRIQLDEKERENPRQVIVDFFENFSIEDFNEASWNWLTTAMTRSPSLYDSALERGNLLFLYEHLHKLLAANLLLLKITPAKAGSLKKKLDRVYKPKQSPAKGQQKKNTTHKRLHGK